MKTVLNVNENSLIGAWKLVDGTMKQDSTCERIQWLTESVLREISVDGNNWTALYQDPADGRYWELSYPQSHMQGGGPPALQFLDKKTAKERYGC
jgi:hypothetical protein